MAKKLSEIATYVESSTARFELYLVENISLKIRLILDRVSLETSVYLFSGVIRNFFLNSIDNRDIDIVVDGEIDVNYFFEGATIKKNSFGGYKIIVDEIKIDLWILGKSWALQNQLVFEYDLERYLPSTAFFNFSAITYSFRSKKFFVTIHFLRFLRDKRIDIVYQPNYNYTLCILNTIYYSEKLGLNLKPRLARLLSVWARTIDSDFKEVQLKHFGKILYSSAEVLSKVEELRKRALKLA